MKNNLASQSISYIHQEMCKPMYKMVIFCVIPRDHNIQLQSSADYYKITSGYKSSAFNNFAQYRVTGLQLSCGFSNMQYNEITFPMKTLVIQQTHGNIS